MKNKFAQFFWRHGVYVTRPGHRRTKLLLLNDSIFDDVPQNPASESSDSGNLSATLGPGQSADVSRTSSVTSLSSTGRQSAADSSSTSQRSSVFLLSCLDCSFSGLVKKPNSHSNLGVSDLQGTEGVNIFRFLIDFAGHRYISAAATVQPVIGWDDKLKYCMDFG